LGYCGVYRNGVSQGFSLPMVTYDSTISPTISDLSDLDDPMLSAHLITRDVLSSIVIDEFSIVPLEPNVVTRVSISFALSASLGGLCLVLLLVSIMLVTVGMHQYILRFAVTYMSVAAVLKSKTAGQARREDVERVCQKICGTRSKKQSMDSVVQSALVQLSESYGIPVETLQPKNKNWMTQQSTFVSLVFLVFFTLLSVLAGIIIIVYAKNVPNTDILRAANNRIHSTHSLRLLFQENNHFHLYEDKALALRRFGSIHSLSVIHTEDDLEYMLVRNSNNPTTAEWWPDNYVLDPWSDYTIADTDDDVTYGTSDIISRIKPSFQAPPIASARIMTSYVNKSVSSSYGELPFDDIARDNMLQHSLHFFSVANENSDSHHTLISTVKETDHLLEHDIGVLSVSRFK
ncbi:hypothetical protein ADUPG1_007311, partial [Aduncisulcus paluster]